MRGAAKEDDGYARAAASKGALNAFVRAVAVDEAPYGIRINSLCPGSVDTPMLRAAAEMFAGAGLVDGGLLAQLAVALPTRAE